MKRLRLEYSVAIYHRSAPGGIAREGEADADSADSAAGLVPSAAR
jgi:hypothetical protein